MVLDNPASDDRAYRFGPFRLLPNRQLLLRQGVPVPIGGRALDILTLLARRPGEVVSKAEILKFCWPGVFVHESNIKVNIAALRRALSERNGESMIATVTGRGYRFVAPVEVEPAEAPYPARSAVIPPKALKQPVIIGRSRELQTIALKLAGDRCVTVVGPGGVGKTTIALAVAHHVQRNYPDGVSFVDLSTVGDSQYAAAAIAAGVGVRQRSEDALSEIIQLIQDRQMLLILDNCEHLHATMTRIVNRLLDAVPGLTLLATSREPLWSKEEHIHRLPSLDAPGSEIGITAETALEFSAVRLFVARAQERGRYVLSDADAPLICTICRHLDGIPLAIELVASKVLAYTPSTLLAMLEQKFLLLGNRERTAPLRQQTFLATLDWSYRLLSEDEALLLRLLSVFAGVFRLEDAVAMAEVGGLDAAQTGNALKRLTSKSLVYTASQRNPPSYRLLKSTRAYIAERLDGGEQEAALRRHASHILSLFERAADELDSRDKSDWMADYADRVDDVRNAMSWAFDVPGDRMLGIRLTVAAIPLWYELSSLGEVQSRVERALLAARDFSDCPTHITMKLMAAKAYGMSFSQHLATTETAWQECYELGIKTKSVKYELFGLWGVASHLVYVGRILEGIERFRRFVALAEREGDLAALAEGQRSLAQCEIYVGNILNARERLETLVAHHQQPSEPVRLARFQAEGGVANRCTLSLALWASGEPTRALQVMREAIERADASGHVVSQSNALARFAIPIAFWSGDFDNCIDFLNQLEENSQREDISMWREVCLFFRSALDAKRGVPGSAGEVRKHVDMLSATGHSVRAPMHYCMSAEAFLEVGALEDAKSTIAIARDHAVRQSAKWCVSEILRIEAMIALRSDNASDAEKTLRLAIAEASAVGALTLELRAALSLSAKLEADGNIDEACGILASAAAKFAKDEAFADLREGRRRLRQLQLNGGVSEGLQV